MTLIDAFNNFIKSKQLKNLSDKSITNYIDFIKPFLNYFGMLFNIENLTRSEVDMYILSLYEKPRATATLATYIRNLKIFLKWLEVNYKIDIKAKTIEVPKTPKKLVKIYNDSEIQLIYKTISAESEWITFRNRVIVFLMLDSGLRQNEVCNIKNVDIDYVNNTMKVIGKGNKERLTFLGNISLALIRKYRELCPYNSEYLLISRRGTQMTADSIKHLINKIKRKLSFEFSSHKLRHNFATNFCIDQYNKFGHVDIYQLMNLMGHEDLKTTQRYLHHAMGILAAQQNNSHVDSILQDII